MKARHILLLWAWVYALIVAALVVLASSCAHAPGLQPCDAGPGYQPSDRAHEIAQERCYVDHPPTCCCGNDPEVVEAIRKELAL